MLHSMSYMLSNTSQNARGNLAARLFYFSKGANIRSGILQAIDRAFCHYFDDVTNRMK